MTETTYASGDLRIAVRADKEYFAKAWEIISKAMESLEYPTFIDSFPVSPYYCARANEYRSTMIGFTAWGCGAYENNVKDLGKYLNGLSEWGLAEKDRRFLEGLDFALTYAFADYAEGDDSITWMMMENVHKAGTPLLSIECAEPWAKRITYRRLRRIFPLMELKNVKHSRTCRRVRRRRKKEKSRMEKASRTVISAS